MFNVAVRHGEIIVSQIIAQVLSKNIYKVYIDCSSKHFDMFEGSSNEYPSVCLGSNGETLYDNKKLAGQSTVVTMKLKGYEIIGTQYHKHGYDVILKKSTKRISKLFRPKRVRG